MNTTKTTAAQHKRSAHRNVDGTFVKNPCEFCGKGCPMNYFSDDHGVFTVLHERCAAKMGDLTAEETAALLVFVQGVNAGF